MAKTVEKEITPCNECEYSSNPYNYMIDCPHWPYKIVVSNKICKTGKFKQKSK